MQQFSVLIVDDEYLARRNLELAISSHLTWRLEGSCASIDEARFLLSGPSIDLVLLDIAMPGMSGLDFARELSSRPNPPQIAFVTAHDDHAVEAFEIFAIDYLLKPFEDKRFAALLERAESQIRQRQVALQAGAMRQFLKDRLATDAGEAAPPLDHIVVRSVGRLDRVEISELERVHAAGNYVELHTKGGTLLHRTTMAAIERRLPLSVFVRVHRTAIVRRDRLKCLTRTGERTWSLLLTTGEEVPVSERFAKSVREAIDG